MTQHTHFHCANCNKFHYGKQNMVTSFSGKLVCTECIKIMARPEIRLFNYSLTKKRGNKVESSYVKIILENNMTAEEAETEARNYLLATKGLKSLDSLTIREIIPGIK